MFILISYYQFSALLPPQSVVGAGGAGVADQSSALADQSSVGAGALRSNGAAVPAAGGGTATASVAQSLDSRAGARLTGSVFHWSGMVASSFCGAFSAIASASFSACKFIN